MEKITAIGKWTLGEEIENTMAHLTKAPNQYLHTEDVEMESGLFDNALVYFGAMGRALTAYSGLVTYLQTNPRPHTQDEFREWSMSLLEKTKRINLGLTDGLLAALAVFIKLGGSPLVLRSMLLQDLRQSNLLGCWFEASLAKSLGGFSRHLAFFELKLPGTANICFDINSVISAETRDKLHPYTAGLNPSDIGAMVAKTLAFDSSTNILAFVQDSVDLSTESAVQNTQYTAYRNVIYCLVLMTYLGYKLDQSIEDLSTQLIQYNS